MTDTELQGIDPKQHMQTDVSHLPEKKQRELQEIVKLIREKADVEMIILFGSHARGDWVEDSYVEDGVTFTYRSDYDVLLILDFTRESGRGSKWRSVENLLRKHRGIKSTTNLEIHDIRHVNKLLGEGHYFFHDIKQEGVLLFDSGRHQLADAKELDPQERQRVMQEHYDYWFDQAEGYFEQFEAALERGRLNIAAFELYQAAERFYFSTILVFTGYKPKQHDIAAFQRQAAALDSRFTALFLQPTDFEKEAYKRLRQAYLGPRFDRHYKITREELEWLAGQVTQLKAVTEAACEEKIAGLTGC